MLRTLLAIHFVLILITQTLCINFHLTPGVKKCLQEEVHKNDIVSGEYLIYQDNVHIPVSILVTDEEDQLLFEREDAAEGKFGFTINYFGPYTICFHSLPAPADAVVDSLRVQLTLMHGVDSRDYKDVIEAEQLKPLEAQLRRLEDLSNEIVQDFAYMRKREEEMRDTNESTNTRVLYFSVFSMLCLLSLAVWQLFYLRRYFKAKKLID